MLFSRTVRAIAIVLFGTFLVGASALAEGRDDFRYDRELRAAQEEKLRQQKYDRGASLVTQHGIPHALNLALSGTYGGSADYDTSFMFPYLRPITVNNTYQTKDSETGVILVSGTSRFQGAKIGTHSDDWRDLTVTNSQLTYALGDAALDRKVTGVELLVCLGYGRLSYTLGCKTLSAADIAKLVADGSFEVDIDGTEKSKGTITLKVVAAAKK